MKAKVLMVVGAALAAQGCASAPSYSEQCSGMGLAFGTHEHVQCQLELIGLQQRRSEALLGTGASLYQSNQPQRPVPYWIAPSPWITPIR